LPVRPGTVLAAVTDVLLHVGEPRSVSEIYAAVSGMSRNPVPRSSVNAALSSHCRGEDDRLRKLSFGLYELRQ